MPVAPSSFRLRDTIRTQIKGRPDPVSALAAELFEQIPETAWPELALRGLRDMIAEERSHLRTRQVPQKLRSRGAPSYQRQKAVRDRLLSFIVTIDFEAGVAKSLLDCTRSDLLASADEHDRMSTVIADKGARYRRVAALLPDEAATVAKLNPADVEACIDDNE